MRFNLNYDDDDGPKWVGVVIALLIAATIILLALGDAIIGLRSG